MTDIQAELVGNVWKVLVAAGAVVAEDDVLVILESMKMEIPILAPHAGTIAEMLVAEGEVVQEGQVVARLERG